MRTCWFDFKAFAIDSESKVQSDRLLTHIRLSKEKDFRFVLGIKRSENDNLLNWVNVREGDCILTSLN